MNLQRWRSRLIGAHSVSEKHLHSTAWSQGLMGVVLATLGGIYILFNIRELFDTDAWIPFLEFLGGRKWVAGWMLLIGGLLGVAGLVFRSRTLSILSAATCAFWCTWLGSFLWYANFTGEPNVGSIFAVFAFNGYVHRLWLLAFRPEPGEKIGYGW